MPVDKTRRQIELGYERGEISDLIILRRLCSLRYVIVSSSVGCAVTRLSIPTSRAQSALAQRQHAVGNSSKHILYSSECFFLAAVSFSGVMAGRVHDTRWLRIVESLVEIF